jgi:glutathione S-transferase
MSSFGGSEITLGYWSIRGLGAPLRMMIMAADSITLNAVNYDLTLKPESTVSELKFDASDWFEKKPALKGINPLMNLPYLIDGDTVVAQTNACFTYLGRRLNMLGSNEKELCQCEQLLCEIMDLRNKMVSILFSALYRLYPL